MNTKILRFVLFVFLSAITSAGSAGKDSKNLGYLPSANPTEDLNKARQSAASTNRRILVVAGGDWCRWCHVLDRFLADNNDVKSELYKTFVVVKVYVGEDKDNELFFSKLPAAVGYPHFWVLSGDGKLVKSVSTSGFEKGDNSYNKNDFLAFIDRYNGR